MARSKSIFLYIVKGEVEVNGQDPFMHHLVEFEHDAGEVVIRAHGKSVVLFGYATSFREPFVAYGPFVMNTREEIMQTYDDYNKGLFGSDRF